MVVRSLPHLADYTRWTKPYRMSSDEQYIRRYYLSQTTNKDQLFKDACPGKTWVFRMTTENVKRLTTELKKRVYVLCYLSCVAQGI